MKKILIIALLFCTGIASAQFEDYLVIKPRGLAPTNAAVVVEGALYRDTDGEIYHYKNGNWVVLGSGSGGTTYTATSPLELTGTSFGLDMTAFDWTLNSNLDAATFDITNARNISNGSTGVDLARINLSVNGQIALDGNLLYVPHLAETSNQNLIIMPNGVIDAVPLQGAQIASDVAIASIPTIAGTQVQQALEELQSDISNSTSSGAEFWTQTQYDSIVNSVGGVDPDKTYWIIEYTGASIILFNASGSTYSNTAPTLIATTTTETLNVADAENDGQTYIKADTGSYTKTVNREGLGITKVLASSKTGYVRIDNDDALKIGNADQTLPQSHSIGMLIRLDPSQLASYTGSLELLTSSDANFKFQIGGDGAAFQEQRRLNIKRGGRASNVATELVEYLGEENGWGSNSPSIGLFKTSGVQTAEWVWVWTIGKSSSDESTNRRNMLYNGGSSNYQTNNSQLIFAGLHGENTSIGNLFNRRANTPTYDEGDTGDGIYPISLSSIDFTISGSSTSTSKVIDIARFVKLDYDLMPNEIALISNGAHPEQLRPLTANEAVYDFGSLPTGVTITGGTPVFNPDETSPFAMTYHNDNTNNVVLTFANSRVQ